MNKNVGTEEINYYKTKTRKQKYPQTHTHNDRKSQKDKVVYDPRFFIADSYDRSPV